jgi:undecaprenyl-diphosphatase
MDYSIYHAVNQFVFEHAWLGRSLSVIEEWSVPLLAVTTVGLWLFARPGADRKWKLACTSALASAAVALFVNQLIAKLFWDRPRPFAEHPSAHVWGSRSHDPSFPSDHASAAFAIAFAIFLYDRAVGAMFLGAAAVIGLGRIAVGVHPGDVLAALLAGLAVALLVARVAAPLVERLVHLVERLTDPLLGSVWRSRARG